MSPDVDQLFQDWGLPATLEYVLHSYDPLTGDLEANSTSTAVTIVTGNQSAASSSQTAAPVPAQNAQFLIRKKEFSDTMELARTRLLFSDHRFLIQRVHESPIPGLLLLECNR